MRQIITILILISSNVAIYSNPMINGGADKKDIGCDFTIDYDFIPGDSLLFAPLSVSFINKTMKGTGDTLSYLWDFDDDMSSVNTNPIHLYQYPGTYFVSLNVKDNLGCEDTYYKNYIVVKDTLQRNEFKYITSSCFEDQLPPCGYDKQFTIANDTLRISGFIGGNCCTDKTAAFNTTEDTIFIKTFEFGLQCTCGCGFCFNINVPSIFKDSIIVKFNNEIYIAKNQTSSIQEDILINTIKIIPNPITDGFTIDYSNLNHQSLITEIYDIYGQLVFNYELNEKSFIYLNSNQFVPGLYLVRTYVDYKIVFMNKIIIK